MNYLLEALHVYAYTERAREKKGLFAQFAEYNKRIFMISILHYNLNIYFHSPKADSESQYSIMNHSTLIKFRQAAIVLPLSGLYI